LGYGLIGFLLTVPAVVIVLVAIWGALASGFQHVGGFGLLAVAAVLYLIALGIVMSALRAIFGTVLYLYAKNGTAPEGFAASDLQNAMKPAT
jgi:hypothetical protein